MTAGQTTETTKQRQSRVGKRPIALPQGVSLTVAGRKATMKGPKGSIERLLPEGVAVKVEGANVRVGIAPQAGDDGPRVQGLSRALLVGMAEGVAKGFATSLDLYGVGYRAEVAGQSLTLALGLSHQVKVTLPAGIAAKVETIDEGGQKRPRLHLSSHDKDLLGQVAAKIKSYRPPEPYKGKGVRFTGEKIREKAGKAGAKGKK